MQDADQRRPAGVNAAISKYICIPFDAIATPLGRIGESRELGRLLHLEGARPHAALLLQLEPPAPSLRGGCV